MTSLSDNQRPPWMGRTWLLRIISVVTALLTAAATLMVFAQDRLFDADDFASTVGGTLQDPAVSEYLAEQISAALIDQVPDLAISGPLLADVIGVVLKSDTAAGIIESAANEAHVVVFDGGQDTLLLEVSDLVVLVQQALKGISPELAESIPEQVESVTVALSSGELTAGTVRLAERVRAVTFVLIALGALAMVMLVVLEASYFRGLARLGFTLGFVGLVLNVTIVIGGIVVTSYGRSSLEGDALAAAWIRLLGDLVSWGWVLVAVGALLASLGWAVTNAGNVVGRARDLAGQALDGPVSALGSALYALALLVVAVWALFSPTSLLTTLVRVAGFGLVVFVLAQVLDRTGMADRLNRLGAAVEPSNVAVTPRAVAVRMASSALVLAVLGVGAGAVLASSGTTSVGRDLGACNGHVELCERRLDEVTMGVAHNSMSSTATDFYLPNHLSSWPTMLDVGIRGFMIDTVYGNRAADGSVRTSFGLADSDSLDGTARQAAEAIRARQTSDLGPQQVFLCHSFCELGAVDATEELTVLRQWLDDNPREVVVLIVQDATDPVDTAKVFDDAGLGGLVHTQALDEPFPTLGEMIESGRRVFIMVENSGEGVGWLHPAFDFSQETPFSFGSRDEFSCAPNRGNLDNPLFIVNHFITLARPSNQTINKADVLLARVEDCAAKRGRRVNMIAVDYATQGDVMAVVDQLNGVD